MINIQTMATGSLMEHFKSAITKLEAMRRNGFTPDEPEFLAVQREADSAEEEVLRRMAW